MIFKLMPSLNLNALDCLQNKRLKLILYIFDTQGAEAKRLDFKQAARELGISRRSLARYCGQLAQLEFISFVRADDGQALIQINSNLLS